jgi:hypothetical protein
MPERGERSGISQPASELRPTLGATSSASRMRESETARLTRSRHRPVLVGRQIRAYVFGKLERLPTVPDSVIPSMPLRVRPAVWASAAIVGVLAAATTLLWAHYGSAVFFEMIMAGLASCF